MTRDLPHPGTRTAAPRGGLVRDLSAVAAAALLVLAAVVVGTRIQDRHGTLRVGWPPLVGDWMPHTGPGTPAALAVAAAVVTYGPSLAARLSWRPLLFTAWGAALAWTWSLALVDGWSRGVAEQLTTRHEYLRVIDRFGDIPATLRDFTAHILLDTPDNWPAHVAGHPPGATVTFVLLDRIGLGGGAWAGAFVITVGTTAVAAILVAVRRLADESLARRAAPFLALAPGAVWVGTSADGFFTAVTAWAVALLALAVTGHRPAWTGLGSGLLFGLTMYLSYGLTLFAVIAAAVLLLGTRRLRPLPYVAAGFLVVPVVFTALGFDWWEAYRLLVTRYYQGAGGVRPYGYWIWANLACTVLVVGPATVAGLRRCGGVLIGSRALRPRGAAPRLALLVLSAFLALLVADLSGMSKAETERIWLPFAFWLLPACALLPGPRGWLAGQAVLALLLNHLLLTGW
ncbi:glycosyltransferase family 39 protein [Streptomyces sp. NPDC086080]|uniref:glycosyltransferase family 39 protein n=1 Tax=Streptomyces sp. NPDC086080 TaxID=3365748 RepID=UPI0037D819B9